MFVVSEADIAAIRAAWQNGGELAGGVEVRRLFPGITDNEHARRCASIIANWAPLPERVRKVRPVRRRA